MDLIAESAGVGLGPGIMKDRLEPRSTRDVLESRSSGTILDLRFLSMGLWAQA